MNKRINDKIGEIEEIDANIMLIYGKSRLDKFNTELKVCSLKSP